MSVAPSGRVASARTRDGDPIASARTRDGDPIASTRTGDPIASARTRDGDPIASARTRDGDPIASARTRDGDPIASARTRDGDPIASARTRDGDPIASARTRDGDPIASARTRDGDPIASARTRDGDRIASARTRDGDPIASARTRDGDPIASARTRDGDPIASARTRDGDPIASARTRDGDRIASARTRDGDPIASARTRDGDPIANARTRLAAGSPRPDQLGGLVQCLLYLFKRGHGASMLDPEPRHRLAGGGGLLDCGGCQELLAQPVTLRCGHTWCRHCLRTSPRCPGCGEAADLQSLRPNVILSHLMAKWFPAEVRRTRDRIRLEELVAQCRFPEALRLLEQLELKPSDVGLQRTESYAGLRLFKEAIEDMEAVCSRRPAWPEILCDLLSPVLENVKEGFLHGNKDLPAYVSTSVGCFQMAPNSVELKDDEMSNMPNSAEKELTCSSQTHSVRLLHRMEYLVGLKKISSVPLLSCQEKAVLTKRKLISSDQEIKETGDGKSKHQKRDAEQLFHSSSSERIITKDLIDASDFECSLCMRLFLEPITTPCGHTFCKGCLERSLDHNPLCPLCKDSLKEYLENRKYAVTYLLEEVIARHLSEELRERQRIHDEETAELSNLTKSVPIFVCTMAYPTVPCPLHVFEPRYRLMIRRCFETGTKQFGMCISDPHNGFTDYGCMLHIRNIHFLPDGRSIVDTVGGNCFKVLHRGQKDGYYIANIEYLKDVKVTGEELDKLMDLHDEVYAQACRWFQNLKSRFHVQILQHFGPMPERETDLQGPANGPAWCWWLLAVLPVDPKYQLSVLSMTSLKNRLIKIQKILTYFSNARDQSK